MLSPPRMDEPNATIIKKIFIYFEKWFRNKKKNFSFVCRACQDESIDV